MSSQLVLSLVEEFHAGLAVHNTNVFQYDRYYRYRTVCSGCVFTFYYGCR